MSTGVTRSACDRCRAQKLRCLRPPQLESNDDACTRCSRLAIQCVTSSNKRPGRPRKNTTNNINKTGSGPSLPQPVTSGPSTAPISGHVSSLPTTPPPSDGPVDILGLPIGVDDDGDVMNCWLSQDLDLFAPPFPFDFTEQQPAQSNAPHNVHPASSPPVTLPPPESGPETSQGHLSANRAFRLADIYRSLCCELSNFHPGNWDIMAAVRVSSGPKHQPATPSSLPNSSDPLSTTIRLSSNLIALLQSISTADSGQPFNEAEIGQDQARCAALPALELRTTEPWLFMSCYMAIVTIYDRVFRELRGIVSGQGSESMAAASAAASAPTDLYLGSVAVPVSLTTCSYLLHCLIEGHLQSLEALLGLPPEVCVSSKMRSGTADNRAHGVIGNQNALALLMLAPHANTGHTASSSNATGIIESLRENMRAVWNAK